MKVTVAQLTLLLECVRTGSVGAAARQLGLTQSGASQSIAALEAALGVALLTRTHHGVTPTAFALTILDDADQASTAVNRIISKGRTVVRDSTRSLSVATVPSIATHLIPQWRKTFQQLYPRLDLAVFEGNHVEVGRWVSDGVAELGLTSLIPAGMSSTHLRTEELLVVGRVDDPVLRGGAVSVEALLSRPLIMAGGCGPIMELLFGEGVENKPENVVTQDMATAVIMVGQGLGLTVFPQTAFPRRDLQGLRTRPLSPRTYRDLHMIFSSGQSLSEPARHFQKIASSDTGH